MPLPVSMEAALITASTRDLVTSSGAISTVAAKSVKRPRTLEMPRCCATAATLECAGSTVHGPGGGSSVPPWRASVHRADLGPPARGDDRAGGGRRVADRGDDDGVRPRRSAGWRSRTAPLGVRLGAQHLRAGHVGHRDDRVRHGPSVPRSDPRGQSHPVFSCKGSEKVVVGETGPWWAGAPPLEAHATTGPRDSLLAGVGEDRRGRRHPGPATVREVATGG